MDNKNPLSEFIVETTAHILDLHGRCESLLRLGEEQTSVIIALRERIKCLEKEQQTLRKEIEQISLLN